MKKERESRKSKSSKKLTDKEGNTERKKKGKMKSIIRR